MLYKLNQSAFRNDAIRARSFENCEKTRKHIFARRSKPSPTKIKLPWIFSFYWRVPRARLTPELKTNRCPGRKAPRKFSRKSENATQKPRKARTSQNSDFPVSELLFEPYNLRKCSTSYLKTLPPSDGRELEPAFENEEKNRTAFEIENSHRAFEN